MDKISKGSSDYRQSQINVYASKLNHESVQSRMLSFESQGGSNQFPGKPP